eukprot:c13335_g1_i1.p1 GENE.c13335_g1_i1~~c13335_g1_i1.p1  ORF type:complete len:289 (+),score=63.51 c13335_g1_i1:98-868(+)
MDDETRPLMGSTRGSRRHASASATMHLNIAQTLIRNTLMAFGSFMQIILLCFCCLCLVAIALLPLIVAIVYWNAPCNRPLSTWLLVYALWPKNMWPRGPTSLAGWMYYLLLNLFSLVWFIVGCFWVFSISTESCDRTLYLVCYWLIVISLTVVSILLLVGCCLLMYLYRKKGLSQEQINALQGNEYKQGDIPQEDAKCSICLLDYEPGDIVLTLRCHHHMHDECLKTWLQTNPTCPMCREPALGNDSDTATVASGV